MQKYAPIVLRYSMAIVILWFASQQFLHGDVWTAYIPDSAVTLSHISALGLVRINAIFELVFGLALLLGFYTRIAAFLLFLHLLDIMYVVGYGEIGVRDFGLALATFSIFLHGSDYLCLDHTDDTILH